jgi:hypothetical protein
MLHAGLAGAGVKSFSIGAQGMGALPATAHSIVSIILDPDVEVLVSFNFVLPRDYVPNSTIKLVTYLHAVGTPSTSCLMFLEPTFLGRLRPGATFQSGLQGFVPKNGSNVVPISSEGTSTTKVYTIAPAGALADLFPGDLLVVRIRRNTGVISDTCDVEVDLFGVDVRYITP